MLGKSRRIARNEFGGHKLKLETLEARLVLDSTVVFNEIMYHPAGDEDALEWVELHNQMGVDMDISGWSLAGGVDYSFAQGTIIPGGGYLVVAASPAELQNATGLAGALGPFTGRLSNGGEELLLLNNSDRTMDRLDYDDDGPWPVAPDGGGVSLEKVDPGLATEGAENWTASRLVGGTPGGDQGSRLETLVRFDTTWSFDQSGADLGTDWREPGFDDGAWSTSAGVFHAGPRPLPGPQNTTLDLGPTTFYFRTSFDFFGDPAEASLELSHVIDDGAVFYLNGVEFDRFNMPAGQVTAATLATSVRTAAVVGPDSVPSGSLVRGRNVLAVELHQDTPSSTDVGFGAQLTVTTPLAPSIAVAFNEVQSGAADSFALELVNHGSSPIDVNGFVIESSTAIDARFTFGPRQLAPGEFLALTESELGFDPLPGDRLFLYTPDRRQVADAVKVTGRLAARLPQATGEWLSPVEATFGQANRFQLHEELVINEILYRGKPNPAESTQEWIELYNRGAVAVDLTGWTLRDAVDFALPSGTVIAPDGYLVVAKDPLALAAQHPGVDIVGPFERSLSNRTDRIVLADAVGNPADMVQYFDRGRWDDAADGSGASLELRNPDADNALPEAWAASRQGDLSSWQTITYGGLGANQGNDPTQYSEFLMGLLDAGEVLLDDISVLQLGRRSNLELIQNGDFESGDTAAWRIIGTQHGEVVVDPDDPQNHVLRLTATGPTEHMHNHAGTTLTSNGRIVQVSAGNEYEISFRARWLSGSNQLNTRLYFNRLGRTTLLDVPATTGTPGERNSTFEENLGPTYSQLRHEPVVPAAGQSVVVGVTADDSDGVEPLLLWYSAGGGAWMSVAMQPVGNGRYEVTIPGQAAGVVQFYVEGQDTLGATSTFPAAGAESRALYVVEDGRARLGEVHNFRIVMTQPDADFLHLPTNVMSNDRIGATVVYNEAEVFYDVGVRLKGSERGRNRDVRVGFIVEFDPLQLFRGVHRTVGIDRSGAGDQFSQKEILVKHGMNHAGNMPSLYDDVIHVIAPRNAHTGSALLTMARYNDVFLDSQYAGGSAGTAFEYELIYFPTTTVGGDPEGLKLPNPDSVVGVPLRSLGDDKEAYRWHWIIKNNRQQDDYSKLIRVLEAMGTSDNDEYHRLTGELLDVDQWLRSFALQTLFGIGDNYATGAQHNAQFYTRPEDGKTLYLPWDMDFTFSAGSTSSLTSNGDLNRLLSLPANRRAYYGHVDDILDTTFNSAYMNPWLEYYSSLLPTEDFGSFANYISSRSSFATGQVSSAVRPVDFAVTTAGPLDVGAAGVATIEGDGWVNVREIRLAGTGQALPVEWFETSRWRVTLPVANGDNLLDFEAYDFQGRQIASDSITVTANNVQRPLVESLRITEIMYHPAAPTPAEIAAGFADDNDFEFIELTNIGADVLDLTGARFTAGIGFGFGTADVTSLAPGGHVLIVQNRAAFEMRYGAAATVAGEYTGRLSNGGEQLHLIDGDDVSILEFTYDDGWYPTTDGGGHSLVIVDATAEPPTWGVRSSWRASGRFGGSPGVTDPAPVPGDANGDGAVNIDDLNTVRNNFGAVGDGLPGDTNGDGRVDGDDLAQVRNNYGVAAEPAQPLAVEGAAVARREARSALRFRSTRGHAPVSQNLEIWRAALDELVAELMPHSRRMCS